MDTLTKATAGVTVWPADVTASGRLVRRGWQAGILSREAMRREGGSTREDVVAWCPHSHKTESVAADCGRKMWRNLK